MRHLLEKRRRRLHTRIIHPDALLVSPWAPVIAYIVQHASVGDSILDLLLAFDKLQGEAHSHVPTDVTMHEPDTRVIGEESNHKMTTLACRPVTRHEGHITARRVVKVESRAATIVTISSCENVEVMSVKMDWVT